MQPSSNTSSDATVNSDILELNFTDLKLGRILGSGAQAVVNAAVFQEQTVAVKQFHHNGEKLTDDQVSQYYRDKLNLIQKHNGNHNLIRFLGVCRDPLCLVMEYCHRNLHKIIQTEEISFERYVKYACQILSGLQYLHSKNTVHRDLKSPNIMENSIGDLKITDFDTAKELTSIHDLITTKGVGTFLWMAPEVLKYVGNDQTSDRMIDIWSTGVILWEMVLQRQPYGETYTNANQTALMQRIIAKTIFLPVPAEIPSADHISKCLSYMAEQRPTAASLYETFAGEIRKEVETYNWDEEKKKWRNRDICYEVPILKYMSDEKDYADPNANIRLKKTCRNRLHYFSRYSLGLDLCLFCELGDTGTNKLKQCNVCSIVCHFACMGDGDKFPCIPRAEAKCKQTEKCSHDHWLQAPNFHLPICPAVLYCIIEIENRNRKEHSSLAKYYDISSTFTNQDNCTRLIDVAICCQRQPSLINNKETCPVEMLREVVGRFTLERLAKIDQKLSASIRTKAADEFKICFETLYKSEPQRVCTSALLFTHLQEKQNFNEEDDEIISDVFDHILGIKLALFTGLSAFILGIDNSFYNDFLKCTPKISAEPVSMANKLRKNLSIFKT